MRELSDHFSSCESYISGSTHFKTGLDIKSGFIQHELCFKTWFNILVHYGNMASVHLVLTQF